MFLGYKIYFESYDEIINFIDYSSEFSLWPTKTFRMSTLTNMSMDIDALVEGVYRDQMDRKNFHGRFVTFGLVLFSLVIVVQFLLGKDNYIDMLNIWYVKIVLHLIIIINVYFLMTGEKYYNEDVGAE
jgi:hypothetical protein